MDLAAEILALLQRAQATGEYFNPVMLECVTDGLERIGADPGDEIREWVRYMWSR